MAQVFEGATCDLEKGFSVNENFKNTQIEEKIEKVAQCRKTQSWDPLGLKNAFLEVEITRRTEGGNFWWKKKLFNGTVRKNIESVETLLGYKNSDTSFV